METQHIINEAKQAMLEGGTTIPMLYLELDDNSLYMYALDILSDEQSIPVQAGMLARLGWDEMKKHPECTPVAASFYAEAWRVVAPSHVEDKMMPVKSKKRQEIITVQFWRAGTGTQQQSYALPVIRNKKGYVVEIGDDPEGPTSKISWQLAAFVQGCFDAKKPEEEVLGKMGVDIQRRVATFSPEKRQELLRWLQEQGIDPSVLG